MLVVKLVLSVAMVKRWNDTILGRATYFKIFVVDLLLDNLEITLTY